MKKLYTIYKQLNIKKENKERRQNRENKKREITNKLKNKIRRWIHKKEIISKIFQRELRHKISITRHVIIKVLNILNWVVSQSRERLIHNILFILHYIQKNDCLLSVIRLWNYIHWCFKRIHVRQCIKLKSISDLNQHDILNDLTFETIVFILNDVTILVK